MRVERQRRGWLGIGLLITAALVVAVAIITGGTLARTVNGVAALLWFGSLWLIWTGLGTERRRLPLTPVTVVTTLVLVLVVKPTDLLMAAVGFSIAGIIISSLAGRSGVQWAAMVPALWLPVHLGVTIGRALTSASQGGATAVRTDPPPTAALVPLMMILAALGGGFLVAAVRRSQRHGMGDNARSSDQSTARTASR